MKEGEAAGCREVMIYLYWRGCGNCGYIWEFMYGGGDRKGPNYCPRCGKFISERVMIGER